GVPATLFLNNDFLDNEALFYRFKVSLLIQKLQSHPPSPALQSILRERLSGRKLERELSPESLLQIGYADRDFLDELGLLLEVDFAGYLAERQPYLRKAEVRDWIKKGFTIGGHSLDHPEFRFIPKEEQIRQAKASVRQLVADFKIDYKVFAFPFTDFGVRQAWFDEMLAGELDASFGAAGLKKDTHPMHGQRVPFEGTDDSARAILKAEYLYYALKAPLGKNQIKQR
ncbi:MAG: polysaccharide deacetylase family protein, partial [Bacteroidota bacterium]